MSDRFHVRGYKEEGTTTTPFDMTVLNDLDRFHLAGDVIDRVPRLRNVAGHLKQHLRDRLVEHRALRANTTARICRRCATGGGVLDDVDLSATKRPSNWVASSLTLLAMTICGQASFRASGTVNQTQIRLISSNAAVTDEDKTNADGGRHVPPVSGPSVLPTK